MANVYGPESTMVHSILASQNGHGPSKHRALATVRWITIIKSRIHISLLNWSVCVCAKMVAVAIVMMIIYLSDN